MILFKVSNDMKCSFNNEILSYIEQSIRQQTQLIDLSVLSESDEDILLTMRVSRVPHSATNETLLRQRLPSSEQNLTQEDALGLSTKNVRMLLPQKPMKKSKNDMTDHEYAFFMLRETKITPNDVSNSEKCSICHDEFILDKTVKILPCKHFFHYGCLRRWVISCTKSVCPLCRECIPCG